MYGQALEPGDWDPGVLVALQEIREIHSVAMTPVWTVSPHEHASDRESPGQFREHDIAPFAGGMRPPTWPLVPARMADWIEAVEKAGGALAGGESDEPSAETLARLHSEFERIHPFLDGNGRTGRLVLNLMLVRLAYPPVIILKRQRPAYLLAMEKADDGDYGPLGEILARAMYDNINRFIVPNVAGPARMVPLAALVNRDFSMAALRQAAQRCRLDAVQGSDGVWRSSRKAVEAYRRSKGRRIAPPNKRAGS